MIRKERERVNTYLMLGIPQLLPRPLVVHLQDVNQPSPSHRERERVITPKKRKKPPFSEENKRENKKNKRESSYVRS